MRRKSATKLLRAETTPSLISKTSPSSFPFIPELIRSSRLTCRRVKKRGVGPPRPSVLIASLRLDQPCRPLSFRSSFATIPLCPFAYFTTQRERPQGCEGIQVPAGLTLTSYDGRPGLSWQQLFPEPPSRLRLPASPKHHLIPPDRCCLRGWQRVSR